MNGNAKGLSRNPKMSTEVPHALSLLLTAWNNHDIDSIAACYSSNYSGVDFGEASPQDGPAGIKASAARYLTAFPDVHIQPEEVVVQDNRVAMVWVGEGTHLGHWMNIPATGRRVIVRGMAMLTIEGGLIIKALYLWDVAGLLRSINLLPEL
jgi:steroid delta-isomerase-like uncharacterized protein